MAYEPAKVAFRHDKTRPTSRRNAAYELQKDNQTEGKQKRITEVILCLRFKMGLNQRPPD